MKLTRRAATLGGLGLIATASSRALAEDGPVADLVEGAEDFRAASDAYVYGYPLVTTRSIRRRSEPRCSRPTKATRNTRFAS